MISKDLLRLTDGHALGFCIYGGPGLKKTWGAHLLPPPILIHEFEGGTASLQPWIRRSRKWFEQSWTEYSQAEREAVWVEAGSIVKPAPYCDVIHYDVMEREAYNLFIKNISEFNPLDYNSVVIDTLLELSGEIQNFVKTRGMESAEALAKQSMEPMPTNSWGGVQERNAIALRKLRSFREQGVFVYLISSEQIDKDYITDPRNQKEVKEEPYSIKGTVNVPGKLVAIVQHMVDVCGHARPVNNEPLWVFKPEPFTSGSAYWEAKDRTGRINEPFSKPNFRKIMDQIYGEEVRKAIYASAREQLATGA